MTGKLKILDEKIKVKQAPYDLDREAAKLSVSFGELEKYECLIGEDLRYKRRAVDQAEFKYSPLGKVFNKGSDEKNKKMTLKRLRSV